MGIVFQDNFLFNTTVRANLRMAKQDATDEEIVKAAEQAEIHDFILSLPDGYETLAGERGQRFSVGQRQRIAIARAILRDPAVLLLDEATSALDATTEFAIRKNVFDPASGRTVLFVTHRLSMAMEADRIFVMNGGRLAELGKHAELLSKGGLYAQLWKKQGGLRISHDGDRADVEPSLLRTIPILEDMDDAVLAQLTRAFVIEHHPEERIVFEQGDHGDKFYIIIRGVVSVLRTSPSGEKQNLAALGDGDHFGEVALLRNAPRNATIYTQTPCIFLTLSRSQFRDFLSRAPSAQQRFHRSLLERGGVLKENREPVLSGAQAPPDRPL